MGTERLKRNVSAVDVFRMADESNPTCAELAPERLIVAGGVVAESLKPLELRILTYLERYAFARALESTRIEIVPQTKQSTVRGGAALVQYEVERRRADGSSRAG